LFTHLREVAALAVATDCITKAALALDPANASKLEKLLRRVNARITEKYGKKAVDLAAVLDEQMDAGYDLSPGRARALLGEFLPEVLEGEAVQCEMVTPASPLLLTDASKKAELLNALSKKLPFGEWWKTYEKLVRSTVLKTPHLREHCQLIVENDEEVFLVLSKGDALRDQADLINNQFVADKITWGPAHLRKIRAVFGAAIKKLSTPDERLYLSRYLYRMLNAFVDIGVVDQKTSAFSDLALAAGRELIKQGVHKAAEVSYEMTSTDAGHVADASIMKLDAMKLTDVGRHVARLERDLDAGQDLTKAAAAGLITSVLKMPVPGGRAGAAGRLDTDDLLAELKRTAEREAGADAVPLVSKEPARATIPVENSEQPKFWKIVVKGLQTDPGQSIPALMARAAQQAIKQLEKQNRRSVQDIYGTMDYAQKVLLENPDKRADLANSDSEIVYVLVKNRDTFDTQYGELEYAIQQGEPGDAGKILKAVEAGYAELERQEFLECYLEIARGTKMMITEQEYPAGFEQVYVRACRLEDEVSRAKRFRDYGKETDEEVFSHMARHEASAARHRRELSQLPGIAGIVIRDQKAREEFFREINRHFTGLDELGKRVINFDELGERVARIMELGLSNVHVTDAVVSATKLEARRRVLAFVKAEESEKGFPAFWFNGAAFIDGLLAHRERATELLDSDAPDGKHKLSLDDRVRFIRLLASSQSEPALRGFIKELADARNPDTVATPHDTIMSLNLGTNLGEAMQMFDWLTLPEKSDVTAEESDFTEEEFRAMAKTLNVLNLLSRLPTPEELRAFHTLHDLQCDHRPCAPIILPAVKVARAFQPVAVDYRRLRRSKKPGVGFDALTVKVRQQCDIVAGGIEALATGAKRKAVELPEGQEHLELASFTPDESEAYRELIRQLHERRNGPGLDELDGRLWRHAMNLEALSRCCRGVAAVLGQVDGLIKRPPDEATDAEVTAYERSLEVAHAAVKNFLPDEDVFRVRLDGSIVKTQWGEDAAPA